MHVPGPAQSSSITPGVFFTPAQGDPAQWSSDDLRENAMIAAVELAVERGVRCIAFGDIATRVGVSEDRLGRVVGDVEECLFAAYDRYIDRIIDACMARFAGLTEVAWETALNGAVDTFCELLLQDPVAARAVQIELDAIGEQIHAKRLQVQARLADALRDIRRSVLPGAEEPPLEAYQAAIYAVRLRATQLMGQDDSAEQISSLTDRVVPWLRPMMEPDAPVSREAESPDPDEA